MTGVSKLLKALIYAGFSALMGYYFVNTQPLNYILLAMQILNLILSIYYLLTAIDEIKSK